VNNLITNRIRFELRFPKEGMPIYCTKTEALFRLKYKYFVERLKGHSKLNDFECWFGDHNDMNVKNQPFVYFEFREDNAGDYFQFILDEEYFQKFKKHFIKQSLIEHFKNKNIFIEPYPVGVDFSIYVFNSSFDKEWDRYSRYDFIIKSHRNEIIFNKTSEYVLISKTEKNGDSFPNIEFIKLKGIDPETQFVKKTCKIGNRPLRVIANRDIKKTIDRITPPTKLSYNRLYNDLKKFYSEHLLDLKSEIFKIQSGGFVYVSNKDVRRVYHGSNLMVSKNGQTDINAATGMREYGPFQPSRIAKGVQFIFIYENSDDANKLYKYLTNGLKHFPGLQTYVGIPTTLADRDLTLKYTKRNLKQDFDRFLSEKFPDANYDNYFYFVIFIGPFKKNYQDDFQEQELYYYIKKKLLKKGISSQFIFYQNIRSDQFHFHLPNIAIAILAKLGGIPWKLKERPYTELIIGFNAKKIGNTQYIGSTVFFDNQGKLKKVNCYEGVNLNAIVRDLKQAIENFRKENPEEELKRIIIHTYKSYGKAERKIEQILREELLLDVPFIYIEINEAKTTTEVCFDRNYEYGMPISGTYIKTGKNEFLLFNNTRYHERPMRSIIEEWPIKIRIYTHDYETIDENKLISQIYEFSRLYWRGLKQKSQPVTTIYSKLIADFAGNFGGQIPKNKITQQTPWFL